ncbi:photosystem II reaction center protein Ycf12 [Anthocerotibacter panamensis]|nr:photosystem II reaction center protein Ycf12 [Anthocerotibacter panamensis]
MQTLVSLFLLFLILSAGPLVIVFWKLRTQRTL